MARIKIRYLVEKKGAGGRRLFYWQPGAALLAAGWRAERLRRADGTPVINRAEAIAAAEAKNAAVDSWRMSRGPAPGATDAIEAAPPPAPEAPPPVAPAETVDNLIRDYKASRFYRDLTAKTRQGYDWNLNVISRWAGDGPVAALDPPTINAFYEEMRAATPAKAAAVVTQLRILFRFAVVAGLDQGMGNPAKAVPISGSAASGLIWPRPAVLHFVRTADLMERWSVGTAIIVQHWIGQREGDLLGLERARYRDGKLWITQSKRGARVAVPHSPMVAARIEAELARQSERKVTATTLIVSETTGRRYTQSNFQHVFAEVRAAAANGIPEKGWEGVPEFRTDYILDIDGAEIEAIKTGDLLFSWFRHTAVTELAIAGNDAPRISGVTGQSIQTCQNIINRYLMPTSAMAEAAVQKRLEWERTLNESWNSNS